MIKIQSPLLSAIDAGSSFNNACLDATVVESNPLVSIDLPVQSEQGEYLLGVRKNRPAQGHWFVPGGRVQKNETLDAAFRRLTSQELGIEPERSTATFKGVYQHFYPDSIFGEQDYPSRRAGLLPAPECRNHPLGCQPTRNASLAKPEHLASTTFNANLDFFEGV